MTVKVEGKHAGECVISEVGPISREQGPLAANQEVTDGQVLKWSGGKLVPAAGIYDSDGVSEEDIAGVAYGNHKADGADKEIPYIARLAELRATSVKLNTATPHDDDADAAVIAELAKKFIILR